MPAGATYEPIATSTLGAAAASIDFSSLSASYTDLRIVWTARTSASDFPTIRLNSDTGTNYGYVILYGNGTAAGSSQANNTATPYLGADISLPTATNTFCVITIDLLSYAGNNYKTMLVSYSNDKNGSGEVNRTVSVWKSTSTVNAISLRTTSGNNLTAGCTATLYGIKAA
jgi:hypothetical protein